MKGLHPVRAFFALRAGVPMESEGMLRSFVDASLEAKNRFPLLRTMLFV
jgi:hypothetical protein